MIIIDDVKIPDQFNMNCLVTVDSINSEPSLHMKNNLTITIKLVKDTYSPQHIVNEIRKQNK